MRTAQLLRHNPRAQKPVLDEAATPSSQTMGVALNLKRRSLLVGPGPDSLAAVAAARRSGRMFDLQRRDGDPALPLYLSHDGRSLEGPRVILEHFAMSTSRVAFRPPVGSVEAVLTGQWLDWLDRAVAVPLSIERGLALEDGATEELGLVLRGRITDALELRAEEIERSDYLVGDYRTIADIYLWACLEMLAEACPFALIEYREGIRKDADLDAALSSFREVHESSFLQRSAVDPPGRGQQDGQPDRAKDDLLPA